MTPADLFEVSWQGGGGYGDPLLRDPGAVAAEVADGLMSAAAAQAVYGVITDRTGLDPRATAAERARLRDERLGYAAQEPPPDPGGLALGPALRLVRRDGGTEVRTTGGAVLCTGSTRWRAGAVARRVDPEPYGITLHEDLAMTAFYCPRSGLQLAVDVHRHDEDPFDDLDLEVPSNRFGIGQAVARVEDRRFVTGHGRYVDDITPSRCAYGFVVRSPVAHARISSVQVAAAAAAPGVLAC